MYSEVTVTEDRMKIVFNFEIFLEGHLKTLHVVFVRKVYKKIRLKMPKS